MKVTLNRQGLLEALNAVDMVTGGRTTKAILQCTRIVAHGDEMTLLGTDLELGMRYTVTHALVDEPGETVLPTGKLQAIVRESNDETLVLEEAERVCHIRGQDSHFQVFSRDPAEFPPVAKFEEQPDFEVRAGLLRALTEKTIYAAARESTRYAINGVLWIPGPNSLRLVATDGRRLALASGELAGGDRELPRVIVPAKTMSVIKQILTDPDRPVSVKLSPNQIVLTCGWITLNSVLVEGHFPKFEEVIPRDCNKKVEFDTAELLSAVRRAALLTNEDSKGVRLSFNREEVVLSSRAPEQGEADIRVPVRCDFSDLQIGFNPVFLSDGLKAVDSNTVTLSLKEGNRPGVLTSGEDFTYVIMPVNLS